MPMGVVSDEELELEISRNGAREIPPPNNAAINRADDETIRARVKNINNGGRAPGDLNVPDSLRRVIAQDHLENGRASAVKLADSFGISASSVSAYANGATSTATYTKPDQGINSQLFKARERIAGKARRRLTQALNEITAERLGEASLKTVSQVAKDMAVIVKQMEPNEGDGSTDRSTKVQVVLYAPRPMEESEFPRMSVKE